MIRVRNIAEPTGLLTQDLATLSSNLLHLDSALRDLRLRIGRVLGSFAPQDAVTRPEPAIEQDTNGS
jgi:hypothetical protein